MLTAQAPAEPTEPSRSRRGGLLLAVALAGSVVAAAVLGVVVVTARRPDSPASASRQLLPVELTPQRDTRMTLAPNPLNRGGPGGPTPTTLPLYYADKSTVVNDGFGCPGANRPVKLRSSNTGSGASNNGSGVTSERAPETENLGALGSNLPLARYQIITDGHLGDLPAVVWLVDCSTVVGKNSLTDRARIEYRTHVVAYVVRDGVLQRIGDPVATQKPGDVRYGSPSYDCTPDHALEGVEAQRSVECREANSSHPKTFAVDMRLTVARFEAHVS